MLAALEGSARAWWSAGEVLFSATLTVAHLPGERAGGIPQGVSRAAQWARVKLLLGRFRRRLLRQASSGTWGFHALQPGGGPRRRLHAHAVIGMAGTRDAAAMRGKIRRAWPNGIVNVNLEPIDIHEGLAIAIGHALHRPDLWGRTMSGHLTSEGVTDMVALGHHGRRSERWGAARGKASQMLRRGHEEAVRGTSTSRACDVAL